MEYRNLGRTGVKVSALCLGTVKFSGKTDEAEANRILGRAMEAGINFLDTAHVYGAGEGERIIGRYLAESGRRDGVVITTKIQPQANDRRTILAQARESLRRLQTDRIDLLLLHRPSPDLALDETLRALDDLVRAGDVLYIGTSGFRSWQILESLWASRELGLARVVCEQAVYSLLARWIEQELVPMARTYGLGLMVWSPLGAGLLTERYTRENPPAHAEVTEPMWAVLETLRRLAREKGCTASQLALAWCLAQPGITCPIAGPSSARQLEDNLGALDVEVTDADRAALDAVAPPGSCFRQDWLGLPFGLPSRHRW